VNPGTFIVVTFYLSFRFFRPVDRPHTAPASFRSVKLPACKVRSHPLGIINSFSVALLAFLLDGRGGVTHKPPFETVCWLPSLVSDSDGRDLQGDRIGIAARQHPRGRRVPRLPCGQLNLIESDAESGEALGGGWAMTLWGLAFEDFFGREIEPVRRNFVDEYLRRRGWNESAPAKAYMSALRNSIMSHYEGQRDCPRRNLSLRAI
jgi:hypothetical protein